VREAGVFDPDKVRRLVAKVETEPSAATEADGMALMAIASTQLLSRTIRRPRPLAAAALAAVELIR
jgi:DNA-binding helix-hairpin-helix protein with protein kinase domain